MLRGPLAMAEGKPSTTDPVTAICMADPCGSFADAMGGAPRCCLTVRQSDPAHTFLSPRLAAMGNSNFSVIIPTLQKSDLLAPMVERYCAHPTVGEVLIVNNAPDSLPFADPKVRVLQQDANIFVNPAWNLGVSEARYPFLAIANDDLVFDTALFTMAEKWLRRPGVGILGPHLSCFNAEAGSRVWVRPVYGRRFAFGTLMFMRSERYVAIPERLKIWFGDDYLFNHQRHRNWVFGGYRIDTPMSVTSGLPEFNARLADELAEYRRCVPLTYDRRFGLEGRLIYRARMGVSALRSGIGLSR